MRVNMKRTCVWLLAILVSVVTQAYDFQSGGVYYTITTNATTTTPGAVTVTSGDGYSGSVTIPASVVNGGLTYNVTAIASQAFANSIHLTAVNIGSNVVTIGYRAFYGCEELTEIVIPDNVKTIGVNNTTYNQSETFVGCKMLSKATLGGGITNMGENMFNGCENLTTVTINSGCKLLNEGTFYGCVKLSSINIPNSLTSIGVEAFRGCTALSTAVIGSGVTTIGAGAFFSCNHLKSVTLGTNLRTIGYRAFYGCELLESVVIPDEVTTLAVNNTTYNVSETFAGCTSLESVTLGAKLASMGSGAFLGCTSLRNVTIKSGCSIIGNGCFSGCTKLASISIPNTVVTIGLEAFRECTALKAISIPNSVTTVGGSAFYGCTAMTSATVGDGVTTLGGGAFMGCTHLTTATLGSNLRTIGYRAFYNCEELESIVIPDEVTTLGINNTTYNVSETFVGCTSLESVTLGAKLASMGSGAFLNCTALKNVTIKSGCSYIGASCFEGCTKIASITIPNTVENLGAGAFSGCTALKNIAIPNSVVSIGNSAFYGCTAMTQATIGDGVTTIGQNAFNSCVKLQQVHIGSEVKTIGYRAFAYCEVLSDINLTDKISAFGVNNTTYGVSETFSGCVSLTNVVLGSRVTSMGSGVFLNCTGLTSVDIHEGCELIGEQCFSGCSKLQSVDIPNSVTTIYNSAFYNCTALTTATIGDGVVTIYASAFNNCTSLSNLTLGSEVRTINYHAFYNCKALTDVVLPDNVKTLGVNNTTYKVSETFANCINLRNVTLGKKLSSVGKAVFSGCNNLLTVTARMAEPITITADVFPYRTTETLYVFADSKELYSAANYWKEFGQIAEIGDTPVGPDEPEEPTVASLCPADITARAGKQIELPIELTNADYEGNVVGVSFTLQLPDGVTVALDEDDDPICELVSTRINKKQFSVTPAQYADGSWGFRVYTTTSTGVISGVEGAIMTITLNIDDTMEDGDYYIHLKENKLSVRQADNSVKTVNVADDLSTLIIDNVLMGDVNGDGEVDLSDAIMVTYYSLNIEPAGFIERAADVNEDGEIDLSDAIIIIYKSLGVIESRSTEAETTGDGASDYLQLGGSGNDYALVLNNDADYLGFQCDILLPEGMTLEDVSLNEARSHGHSVMFNQLENGKYRVVAFSLVGHTFAGNAGELLKFEVSGTQDGDVKIENIFFVDTNLQKKLFADMTAQTTSIDALLTNSEKGNNAIYDLQGRKVTVLKKGLYLQNGKKYLVK